MAMRRVTAPSEYPVSLAEVKEHLRVTSDDQDSAIERCLMDATAAIDGQGMLGRAMVSQQWVQYEARGRDRIELDMTPVIGLISVTYIAADGSQEAGDVEDLSLETDGERFFVRGVRTADLADRLDAVQITFSAGWGAAADVPPDLGRAVKTLAAHYFELRELAVVGTIVSKVPESVESIVNRHKVRWVS